MAGQVAPGGKVQGRGGIGGDQVRGRPGGQGGQARAQFQQELHAGAVAAVDQDRVGAVVHAATVGRPSADHSATPLSRGWAV